MQQIDYAYDAVGNLLKKTDYSANRPDAYTYHTRQPNAVATVLKPDNTPVSFSYDARGNLTTGDGLTATYNTWDKPTRLTRSKQGISTTMAFTYGADLMRYKQVRTTDGISSTTYYIDKLYEETHTAGRTEWKAYISDVAVVGETQQQGRYIAFTHKDRLGSGTTFTDHHGQVTALRTFDPFGKPRGNDGASLSNTTLDNLDQSRRGFTDHEHLDEIDIIHMNGRVYDYNLGRFMSVDPVIQSPGNSQSMNPYSYIMNNPLAGTDPTGYEYVRDMCSRITLGGRNGCGGSPGDKTSDNNDSKQEETPVVTVITDNARIESSGNFDKIKKEEDNINDVGAEKDKHRNGDSSTNKNHRPPGVTGEPDFVDANGVPHYITTPESGGVRRDNLDGAETVYGETSSLYPQTDKKGSNPYNSKNWNSDSYDELQAARTAISVISERNNHTQKKDGSSATNPIEKRAWDDSVDAANNAENFSLPTSTRHFFIRQKDIGRQKPWWAGNKKPYKSYGPFINVGGGDVPRGNQTYIDIYDGVK